MTYWNENLNVNNAHGTLNVFHYEAGSITAAADWLIMSGTDIKDANNLTLTLNNPTGSDMTVIPYVSNYSGITPPTTFNTAGSVWTALSGITAVAGASSYNNYYVERAKFMLVAGSAEGDINDGCFLRVAWKTQ